MTILNELDRYHLAADVIDRVPGLHDRGAHVKQLIRDHLVDHVRYIEQHGDDPPEIKDWIWPGTGSGGGGARTSRTSDYDPDPDGAAGRR
jgi:xylulose-5-phosphate/fructose-6-phosphate phosphoketolase